MLPETLTVVPAPSLPICCLPASRFPRLVRVADLPSVCDSAWMCAPRPEKLTVVQARDPRLFSQAAVIEAMLAEAVVPVGVG